jgi:hypothetical protein
MIDKNGLNGLAVPEAGAIIYPRVWISSTMKTPKAAGTLPVRLL